MDRRYRTENTRAASYKTGEELNEIFKEAKAGTTIILEGEYRAERTLIQLPDVNNVTINAVNAVFKTKTAFLLAENSGLHWIGGRFVGNGTKRLGFTILHVNNAVFENMIFERASTFGRHVFDLLGCDGITIQNCEFIGFGKSSTELPPSTHGKYAEAIQIDHAIESGIGGVTEGYKDILENVYKGSLDGKSTKNVTVRNNIFKPYMENGEVLAWAQCPLGQHAYSPNDQNENIIFTNNEVVDPIPLNEMENGEYMGALHFVSIKNLRIRDNIFKVTDAKARRENWIQIVNKSNGVTTSTTNKPSSDINITRNNFIGYEPTKAYVRLGVNVNSDKFAISKIRISNNVYINPSAQEPTNMVEVKDTVNRVEKPNAYGNHGMVDREIVAYTGILDILDKVYDVYTSAPYGTPGSKKIAVTTDVEYKNKEISVTEEQTNLESTYVKATMDGEAYFFVDKRAVRKK